MNRHPRRAFVRLSITALLWPATASAAALAETDARAVRAVVQAQLDALAADDAARAYSFASAAIRIQFADADSFMAMVKAGYPAVIRPAGVTFFAPLMAQGAVMQTVQLRDRAGALWRAIYQLVQQGSDGWRINGCVVVPDAGKSVT